MCNPAATFSAISLTVALAAIASLTPALAHDDRCSAIAASVSAAAFDDRVEVSCTDSDAIIASDTYPPHESMTGIVATNEQLPVPADYAAPILLSPELRSEPLTGELFEQELCR